MPKTIECPRCKGKVGIFFKGEALEVALERHEMLTHGVGPPKQTAPAAPAVPAPRRRMIKQKG